jgi:hypothetical protein
MDRSHMLLQVRSSAENRVTDMTTSYSTMHILVLRKGTACFEHLATYLAWISMPERLVWRAALSRRPSNELLVQPQCFLFQPLGL